MLVVVFFLHDNTGKSAHLWRCRYYDDYVECVGVAVKPVCGSDASTWQKTYVNKLHQPALNYIGCSGSLTFTMIQSLLFSSYTSFT